MTPVDEEVLVKIRVEIDNYRASLLGLLGFKCAATWRSGNSVRHSWSLGRRMTPLSPSTSGPSDDLTPDGVLQLGESLGYVVEAKRTLPSNRDHWRKTVRQIAKYDQALAGWWTGSETIPSHNVVALVWTSYCRDFQAFVERLQEDGSATLSNRVSIIEFSRLHESTEVLRYRLEWGTVDDQQWLPTIRSGVSVPIEVILAHSDKAYEFYDAVAPVEYLMAILWQNVFTNRQAELEYDQKLRARPFEVSVSELAVELRALHGSNGSETRERRFPRDDSVREALNAFVRIGLARDLGDDRFLILFKTNLRTKGPADLISRFAQHRTAQSAALATPKQLPLAPQDAPPSAPEAVPQP